MPTPEGQGRRDVLERLRALCLALLEVTERLSHGEPTWFVRGKKTFVMFADRHHDDRLACWLAARPGDRDELIATDPATFFVPPYVGGRGWIGLRLDGDELDWTLIGELVTEAYRTIAPASLSARLPGV